ncbi:response regulator transcription factor [Puniceicoccaceae bacterium K14]|nr:response regulator transcription factor [Puniceicoccaceae bacterium K14]
MKSIYIVEDQTAIREMLVDVVSRHNFNVVGQSGNGQDALKDILELQPDIAVIDAKLPELNGLELLKRLTRQLSGTRFLIFSAFQNPVLVKDMLEAGAHGFIEKDVSLKEFLNGLKIISTGGTFFGPSIAELIRTVVANPNSIQRSKDFLTEREREVLQLIAEGNSTKDIARRLGLSVKTIDNHRTNMMRKLDLHNVASITRYAMQNGLIEVENVV